MNFLRCEKNIAGDPVAIMGNSIGREVPYYFSDLKTLIIDTSETLTECNKAMTALKTFCNPTSPATQNLVGQTINYNGTDYEILSHDNNEIIFTDGKNIYSWNGTTGSGLQNTGNKTHKLCTGFNPKPYSPDIGLLNAINTVTKLPNKYVGKAFNVSYASTAYIFDSPANQGDPSHMDALVMSGTNIHTKIVYIGDINYEIPVLDFVSQIKETLEKVISNELSELLFKEF